MVLVSRSVRSDANERLARTAFPPPYVIDQVEGDRVLISTHPLKPAVDLAV